MKHCVGLDVSVKETTICIVDETGKIVREAKLPTEPEAIVELLKAAGLGYARDWAGADVAMGGGEGINRSPAAVRPRRVSRNRHPRHNIISRRCGSPLNTADIIRFLFKQMIGSEVQTAPPIMATISSHQSDEPSRERRQFNKPGSPHTSRTGESG